MPDAPDALALHDIRPEHGATHDLLQRVDAKLDRVLELLADRERMRGSVPRLQAGVGAALLPEIAAYAGDAGWSCTELLNETKRDPRLAASLTAAIGPLDGGACRRLGKLLQRVEGAVLGDYRLERVGECRSGALWSVTRV